jgi:hypothetical protein
MVILPWWLELEGCASGCRAGTGGPSSGASAEASTSLAAAACPFASRRTRTRRRFAVFLFGLLCCETLQAVLRVGGRRCCQVICSSRHPLLPFLPRRRRRARSGKAWSAAVTAGILPIRPLVWDLSAGMRSWAGAYVARPPGAMAAWLRQRPGRRWGAVLRPTHRHGGGCGSAGVRWRLAAGVTPRSADPAPVAARP